MPITATFPTITFPHRGELVQDEFVTAQETAQDLLSGSLTTVLTTFKTEANALETNVNDKEASAVAASDIAISAANYVGDWVSQGYNLGESVSYSGATYACKLTHATGFVPTNTTYWQPTGLGGIIYNSATKATPVDADEFGFLDSAASFIVKKFTWANLKSAIFSSPTLTGTVALPSTTSIGTVSDVELSYLAGVTSAIQTQITAAATAANAKIAATNYASADGTTGGTVKARLNGSTLYLTTNGNNA